MSWSPGMGIISTIGLTVGETEPISLRACRSEATAYLVIGQSMCEIRLDRIHVETLRDQIPTVLNAMDRAAADESARTLADLSGERAAQAAATAAGRAADATSLGATELAAAAHAAANRAADAADAVGAAVEAFVDAAATADDAAEKATEAAHQLDAALRL